MRRFEAFPKQLTKTVKPKPELKNWSSRSAAPKVSLASNLEVACAPERHFPGPTQAGFFLCTSKISQPNTCLPHWDRNLKERLRVRVSATALEHTASGGTYRAVGVTRRPFSCPDIRLWEKNSTEQRWSCIDLHQLTMSPFKISSR